MLAFSERLHTKILFPNLLLQTRHVTICCVFILIIWASEYNNTCQPCSRASVNDLRPICALMMLRLYDTDNEPPPWQCVRHTLSTGIESRSSALTAGPWRRISISIRRATPIRQRRCRYCRLTTLVILITGHFYFAPNMVSYFSFDIRGLFRLRRLRTQIFYLWRRASRWSTTSLAAY